MQEASATEAALDSVKKLMQAGDFGKAEKQLLTMHDEVEKNDDVLYMLAVCQRYLSKHSSALATLEKLKSLVPEHSRAFQETGHVYRAMNNAGAALNAFSRATQINPALAASFRAQIDILTATDRSHLTGQLKQQLESLEALPKPLVAVTDLIAQGKLIKAEQLCKAFMQKVPRNIEGMRLLADIGSRLGVLEDAEFLLESAVEFAPDHTKARIDYIQVLRKRQNYQESLRQAKLLLDADPSNPQFQSVFAVESMLKIR